MDVRNIRIEDFDYPLPDERIALHPLEQRDSCKLLVASPDGRVAHRIFSDLPLLLKPDTLIVANETKVIRARMEFEKETGARIEIFLLEPLSPHDYVTNFASTARCSWTCLVGNRKRWKDNPLTKRIEGPNGPCLLSAALGEEQPEGGYEVEFSWDNPKYSFAEIVEAAGYIPIPPYLKRESEEADTTDYQTVYSHTEGSVAAPTAGLHFTTDLISRLRRHGDEFATVTLHVGAGTFQPVKSREIGDHQMHTEWISVSRQTIFRLIQALENGCDILAVGTTSVRTLESLPYLGLLIEEQIRESGSKYAMGPLPAVTQWMPYEEKFRHIDTVRALRQLADYLVFNELKAAQTTTSIMIAPGYRWRIVNRLITNFHQPKSTLLLLVSSFIGSPVSGTSGHEQTPLWRKIYDEALANDYRFLSYGDACLFTLAEQPVELPLSKSMVLREATVRTVRNILTQPDYVEKVCDNRTLFPEGGEPFAEGGLCDDVCFYLEALRQTVESVIMPPGRMMLVNIGDGAAPLRFLMAFAASLPGAAIKIDLSPALQRRPYQSLLNTLRDMGADIELKGVEESRPHILIRGKKLKGGKVATDANVTSQNLSALLMASPLWEEPMMREDARGVSKPYIRMTEKMMKGGVRLEPDWSAAAFFYEYVFVSGRKSLTVDRLVPPAFSLQGDAAVCDLYGRLGVNTVFHSHNSESSPSSDAGMAATLTFDPEALEVLRKGDPLEYDFTDTPDLVPSIVVAVCYRQVPFRFHGIAHLRFKESDRLDVLQRLLTRLGYEVECDGESLAFNGEFKPLEEFPMEIESYGDHRIAMAFYPLELAGMVSVTGKNAVTKSFPDFYRQFPS